MIIIFFITAFIILLYFTYPLWLIIFAAEESGKEEYKSKPDSVSVVLLSYNGCRFLEEKISSLLTEISHIKNSELIIIDDNSTDGSKEIIEKFRLSKNIRIVIKPHHKGIPDTMNMGVELATYNKIVFCDQRQVIPAGAVRQLSSALDEKDTGAVSACLSDYGKDNCVSVIRKHENFIKSKESISGNLIGVYGPFYAIKKEVYRPIPDNIILDDLYLSLKILETKKIRFLSDCTVVDENINELYDYKRAKRYLHGFIQILRQKTLLKGLSGKQKTMLLWHKYLRLTIPFFLLLSYISCAVLAISDTGFLITFIVLSFLILLSFMPWVNTSFPRVKNLFRINLFYLIAFTDISAHRIFKPKTIKNQGSL